MVEIEKTSKHGIAELSSEEQSPIHPDDLIDLNNLATNYKNQLNYAQAEPLYDQILIKSEEGIKNSQISTDEKLQWYSLNSSANRALAEIKLQRERVKAAEDKRQAIEDIMAMFAHQFRGGVATIRYNAEHQNDQRVYIYTSRSMSGLLDIAGVLSTNPETLVEIIKNDQTGESSPESILVLSLKDLLIDLVSLRNRERMSPHYLAYAKRQGIVPLNVKLLDWTEEAEWQKCEAMLQANWDNECGQFAAATFETINNWMEKHLLSISVEGLADSTARFAEYGAKASILRVIFTEVLKNAIKHATPGSTDPIALKWLESQEQVVFTCTNPSTKASRGRAKSKGGGRGHNFIRIIVDNLGGNFEPNVFYVSNIKITMPKL